MKRIIIVFFALFLAFPSFCQEDYSFKNEETNSKFIKWIQLGYQFGFPSSYRAIDGNLFEYSGLDLLKMRFIVDYQLNESISMGLGVGLSGDINDQILDPINFLETVYYPIFADFRKFFLNKRIYINTYLGYTFLGGLHVEGYEKIGLYVNPNAGVRFKISKMFLNVDIGYELQRLERTYHTIYNNTIVFHDFMDSSHAISLNLGLSF